MGKKGRKNKPGKKKVEPAASLVARLGVGPVQFCVCYIFSTGSVYIVGSRLSSQSMWMVQTRNVNLGSFPASRSSFSAIRAAGRADICPSVPH